MPEVADLVALAIGAGIVGGLLWAAIVSYREEERRAVRRLFVLALVLPLPWFAVGLFELPFEPALAWTLVGLTALGLVLFFVPIPLRRKPPAETPGSRFDERDIMFSRKELIPGSEKYIAYYKKYPEREILDNAFRKEPGLLPGRRGWCIL